MIRLARLGLVVLWAAACVPSEPPTPTRVSVLLVGIDGATWTVMGPLVESGELPAFARLLERGAHATRFGTMETTKSPLVWTSVATGRLPEDHGILDFAQPLRTGERVPATSNARKVKALWNLLSEAGGTVGVLGWWATWPAEDVNGYVVTDHANPANVGWMAADPLQIYWTADPAKLRRLLRDFSPLDLAPVLNEAWLDPDDFPYQELQQHSGLDAAQMERLEAAPWNERDRYSWFKTFYAVDRPLVALSRRLARERPTDLQMLYLRGPDPVQHYAWDLVEPERYAAPPLDLDRDRGLVQGVYRYVDSFLTEILADLDPSTVLIVASDHGAEADAEAARAAAGSRAREKPGGHTTAAKGVLFLAGPNVRRGYAIREANPLDLMPTVAWLLGLPVAEDLPGRILSEAFTEDFVASQPVVRVPTYGARVVKPARRSPADAALLEQLRALGYLE